jgi:hypothetical protein
MESQPEHHLGPSLSLVDGAPFFLVGEFVLVRIPGSILEDDEVTAGIGQTALPLTSNGSSPQHFAFIREVTSPRPGVFKLEFYPVISFTRRGGALAGYNEVNDAFKAKLLPLPRLSLRHPTPEAFGAPLNLGDWSTFRDSWLSVIPKSFIMPGSRPVSFSCYH